MKIAECFVEIRAESSKAEQDVRQRAKSLGGTFAQIFGAAAFAAGINKSIDAASRLQQAVGATDAVFGKSGKSIDAWAKNAARAMGLSETASREALSKIGSQLVNFGYGIDEARDKGQELVALGADLAATFGGTTTDAVDALSSALRGELDPIERYAVSINDARLKAKALELGLYSGKGAIDAHAKAQAVLALVTEQSANAQGQFGRESGTAAGQLAISSAEANNAAASLGQNFLPVYERVVQLVGFLADKFGALPPSVQTGVVALAAIAVFAQPLRNIVGLTKDIAGGMKDMSANARNAAGGAAALVTALVALDAWNKVTENAGDAKDAVNAFLVATEKASFATDEGVVELANSFTKLAKEQGMAQGDIDKTLDVLSAGFRDGNVQANLLGEQMKETFEQLLDIDPSKAFDVAMALDNIRQAADAGDKSAREHLDAYGLTNDVIDDFVSKAENATAAQQILGGATADTAVEFDNGADSARTYTSRVTDLETAFRGLLGILDRRDAIRGMEDGFADLQQAADDAFYAAASGAEDADQKARDYQQAQDDMKRKVIEFGDEIGNLPPEQITDVIALIDQGKFDEAEAKLKQLEHDRNVMFSAVLDPRTDKITIGSLGNIALSARGRYVDRPMITAVGEGGRHEVILPLENRARMVDLLGDPRVAGPVSDALGSMGPAASPASSASAGGSMTVINNNYGSERGWLVELMRRMDAIRAGG